VTRKSCRYVFFEDVISSDEEDEEQLFSPRVKSFWNWNTDAEPLFPEQFPEESLTDNAKKDDDVPVFLQQSDVTDSENEEWEEEPNETQSPSEAPAFTSGVTNLSGRRRSSTRQSSANLTSDERNPASSVNRQESAPPHARVSNTTTAVHDEEQDDMSLESHLPTDCCNNCHRCASESTVFCHRVALGQETVPKSRLRQKFSNLKWRDLSPPNRLFDDHARIQLCEQCKAYLTSDTPMRNRRDAVWPAMIWKWLSSETLIAQHGNKLWSIIPTIWRPWWIQEVQRCHQVYETVTLQHLPSLVTDVTISLTKFEAAISSNEAVKIRNACNEYLRPAVKCPWGCSEYYHKCGQLNLDVFMAKWFGNAVETVSSRVAEEMSTMAGMRCDFLSHSSPDHLLYNPKWEVQPSIAFVGPNEAPVLLTCRFHKNGSRGRYLHPPKSPNGALPAKISDQLSPAVIRPNTIKQLKPHHFSNTYQMQRMEGQYNGVDTLRVCEVHNFSEQSSIMMKNESLAIKGRRDIKALVGKWCQDGKILPPSIGKAMMEQASRDFSCPRDLEPYCEGATFVTLADAMKLHMLNKFVIGDVINIPSTQVEGERVLKHYVPPWPKAIVNVHPYNEFGCDFPILPDMCIDNIDCRLPWYLVAMHVTLPSLWESSAKLVCKSEDWTGWLLTYVARKCYPERSQTTKSALCPFRYPKQIRSKEALSRLLLQLGLLIDYDEISREGLLDNNVVDTYEQDDINDSDHELYGGYNDLEEDDGANEQTYAQQEQHHQHHLFPPLETTDNVPIQSDGLFHPSDFRLLFCRHRSVLVCDIGSLQGALASEIEEVHDCLIVYQQLRDGESEALPDSEEPPRLLSAILVRSHLGDEWELRFVGGKSGSGPNVNHQECMAYFRHGGQSFSGWWKQQQFSKKKRKVIQEKCAVLPDSAFLTWDIAVYIKQKQVELAQVRDAFLGSMGGQVKAHCKEHDFPLIAAPFRSGSACCFHCQNNLTSFRCTKQVGFQCPVANCDSALCIFHHNSLPTFYGEKFLVSSAQSHNTAAARTPSTAETRPAQDDEEMDADPANRLHGAQSNQDEQSFHDSDNLRDDDNESFLLLHATDMRTEERILAENASEEDSSIDSDALSELQRDYLMVEPAAGPTVLDDPTNEDLWGYRENEVPMTVEGVEPMIIRDNTASISGCVILNNMGSLLARRDTKLRGTRRQQNFLQRIVSTTPGNSVPLVYPEAMLFPSIFWKDDGAGDAAILGAVPCGFLAHDATLKKHGVASIQSHVRARITNTALATSTNVGYLCFAFDQIVNLGCRHEDVRVLLHRGVVGTSNGIRVSGSDKNFFDTDSCDSRPTVNKLAAAVAEKQATYFFTHTANQKLHFGLSPIKEWIDSDDVMEVLCRERKIKSSWDCQQEVREALQQEAAVTLLRNWIEVSIIYMKYIATSPEQPLGDVEHIWWRFEFQDTVGNLPHIHALIWLRGNTIPLHDIQDRIRGSLMHLIRPEEMDNLVTEGLLSCAEETMEIQELAERVLAHICSSRCQKRVGIEDGQLRCRVTNNGLESPNPLTHTTKEIDVQHFPQAEKILLDLGLYTVDPLTGCTRPSVDCLKATKHFPPSNAAEGNLSACNGVLFALTQSAQNLKLATGYLASRYLAKYLALVDENNRVYIGTMSGERNSLQMDTEVLHNTKVTESAIQEAKRHLARRDRKHPTGRAISIMEMICVLLGYDQVYSNFNFLHIPTVPLEERPAMDRAKPFQKLKKDGIIGSQSIATKPEDLDPGMVLPSFKVRNQDLKHLLPRWRQLGNMEALILRDQCLTPLTLDSITIFSIRPPELRFVRRPKLYFQWFYRDTSKGKRTFTDAVELQRLSIWPSLGQSGSAWIDGSDCQVYVRPWAISEILSYLLKGGEQGGRRSRDSFYPYDTLLQDIPPTENPWNTVHTLFSQLDRRLQLPPRSNTAMNEQWTSQKTNLIGPAQAASNVDRPVVWYNSVKPTHTNRWLVHLLLSMGEFDNEMNLLGYGDIVDCFVRAKLIGVDPRTHETDVRLLAKRYILEQLVFLPGSTRQFDKHVIAAHQTLHQALIHRQLPLDEMPPALYTHLVAVSDAKARDHMQKMRTSLSETVVSELRNKRIAQMPADCNALIHATVESPLDFRLALLQGTGQTDLSFQEQIFVLQEAQSRLNHYQNANMVQTKNLVIVGGPGVGKTTVLLLIVFMSLARGLHVAISAIMSERAKQLGGEHLFQMFCIPVNEKATSTRLAELAIARLLRQPKRLAMIRSLDVLYIDELGQVSAELISVLDIMCRRVRNSTAFFGGILVIATMDAGQLHPVDGRPPLLSVHMLTCFLFQKLTQSVRACNDAPFRRIQDLSRMRPRHITQAILEEFCTLIETQCTFVDSWDHPALQPSILRMFGKKAAARLAEQRLLASMRRIHGSSMLYSKALDSESTLEGNWIDATNVTSKALSQKIKAPPLLAFYPKAQYEITFNKEGYFSQSQLAILAKMPSRLEVDAKEPVSVYVAPEGCKSVPLGLTTREEFLSSGFTEHKIGIGPERAENIGLGLQGKRKQYGLRHRIASTIHAGMGQDLCAVITKVDTDSDDYKLWEKEQVVVLLSRTHFAKDIIFVGPKKNTSEALATLLLKRSQYSDYMDYLLDRLAPDVVVPVADARCRAVAATFAHTTATGSASLTSHTSENANSQGPSILGREDAAVAPPVAPPVAPFLLDIVENYPFRPIDVQLPQDNSGFVYILVSRKQLEVTYIGETKNLAARFDTHNRGAGAATTTDPHLRPWGILAYVCGFEGCPRAARQYFETLWQASRREHNSNGNTLDADAAASLAENLVANKLYKGCFALQDKTLLFVRCGRASGFTRRN
jgi:predicted GIY-YIG superfamily endonuclease